MTMFKQAIRFGCFAGLAGAVALGGSASPSAAAAPSCPGDCDRNRVVMIDELLTGVLIALGAQLLSACPEFDPDGDEAVTIDNLLAGVAAAQNGCASAPTVPPTIEPSATPTASPTPKETPFGAPSDLTVAIDGGEIRLAWVNADPAGGYTRARLLRRLNTPVAGPDDSAAEAIYSGSAANAAHPLLDLLPDVPGQPRTYHYAVFACEELGDCGAEGAGATLAPTVPEVLRGGGYVIHWRHASADVCVDRLNSPVLDWWKSCEANCDIATARQLNDKGRAEAAAIGGAFDILGIPVGRVLSSEYCRNFTTAELMDFGPEIELLPSITVYVYDEPNRCANSHALIAEVPAAGTNTAIIGHAGFSGSGCPVLDNLAWGEAAIFKPDGAGESPLITRLTAEQWDELLPAAPSTLSASLEPTQVRLTWTNAPTYPSTRLLRRLNAPVDGAADPAASVLHDGAGDTVLDPLTALLPDTAHEHRTYHYAVYGCVGSTCEQVGSHTMATVTTTQALRAGGYVIHWRHASADVCSDQTKLGPAATTSAPNWWKSCDGNCTTATARQLNATGRNESFAIGQTLDQRGVPIGRVVSSEFCRNLETAQLMDFGPPIEPSPAITFFVYDEVNRCANSFALLAEVPAAGTNTALIGHAGNACSPLSDLPWAGAAIYKPDGQGSAVLIDPLVTWDEWATLP